MNSQNRIPIMHETLLSTIDVELGVSHTRTYANDRLFQGEETDNQEVVTYKLIRGDRPVETHYEHPLDEASI